MQNISVRFTNETPLTVSFFLNGGGGLETSLGPSASQSYTMVVDPGVQPTVGIHQPTGETLEFTVADQGGYAFRFKDGKIVNFFEAQPDGSTVAFPGPNISVRFTNETPLTVSFFLNGGGGLETSLGPSASQSYTMVVDPGVQPTVGIHQPTGETLEFTVADQGGYAFRFKDGKIVNFFEAQPDGSTAAFPGPNPTIKAISDLAALELEREVEAYLTRLMSQYPSEPEAYIPFNLDKQQASRAFTSWLNSLSLVPGDLTKTADLGALRAIYVPFWAVNSITYTTYSGERGEENTDTEQYTDASGQIQTRQVTKTEWTPVSGQVSHHFDDLALCGSSSLFEAYVSVLMPKDGRDLQLSRPDPAENVTVLHSSLDPRAAFNKACPLMESEIEKLVEKDIGGKQQKITKLETVYGGVSLKQFLVPAFEGSYQYKGKEYKILINGDTGEVMGDYPVSAGKVTIMLLLIFGIFIIVFIVVAYWLSG